MKPIFADSSYYVALLSPADAHHDLALDWSEQLTGKVVVTEYVLVELGSLLSGKRDRLLFIELLKQVDSDLDAVIVPASRKLFRRGVALFAGRLDKEWSLTDCISFVVMTERKMVDVLTADHHFEQAGFKVLLK